MTDTGRPAVVIAATPTSNGDLHVGHIAGPYLAADVYARYLRARGRPVIYTTCTDDNQTYVVSTARRKGIEPGRLIEESTAAIARTMAAVGLSTEGLPPIDDLYTDTVVAFVTTLFEAGRFRRRTVRFPYATRAGTYLFDGLVSGTCPHCLAGSSGGACEGCGHPNNFDELLDPRSSMDPDDPVEYREADILVFPLEEYRDRLTAYYAARRGLWRPHGMQLVEELLAAGPLPDVPVTVPSGWGIPVAFAPTPGQRVYPWIEAIPASMYATWWSARQDPTAAGDDGDTETDTLWRDGAADVVFFHGFDNVFHWGLLDIALLMAHDDRYATPVSDVCNEFYELDNFKFSTSRNHLIWAADLVAEVPRDLVRFYLCLTAPEYQRTNFAVDEMRRALEATLLEPWRALGDKLRAASAGLGGEPLPTTPAGRDRCARMAERMRSAYELATYSPRNAAATIATHLARLAGATDVTPGDLFAEVRTLLAWSAPILVDTAVRAAEAGVDLPLSAPAEVAPFTLPDLAADVAAVDQVTSREVPMKLLAVEARQYLAYYRPRYQQVQDLGVDVYVLNGEGAPDFWPEERYRIAGSIDLDTMVAAARAWHAEEHFDGVITFAESAVVAVAALAEALGLPSIGVDAAKRSRNKLLMRQGHQAAGAPIPRFRFTPTLEDALAAADEFGYPVILKPTLGAASYYVFRVDGADDMRERFAQAITGIEKMPWSANEIGGVDPGPVGLMVESFLDGREYLMEALVWDDEVYLGSVVDRITQEGATFDDDVHHAPTSMSAEDVERVHAAVAAAVRGQGLRRSAMHAEVRFHKGEPHVLEIAARVGGGGLDMIAKITADYDPIAAVRDVAAGIKPKVRHFTPTGTHITAMCLLSGPGIVANIDVPAEVSESDRVFLLKITARPGDLIRRPPDGNTIIGFLGTTGTSEEDAFALMNDFSSKITVTFTE